jgi:hypothetical protein
MGEQKIKNKNLDIDDTISKIEVELISLNKMNIHISILGDIRHENIQKLKELLYISYNLGYKKAKDDLLMSVFEK